ncbi:MAG: rhodanese-like domain-containing protein, partial [Bacteroidales bacterium]|nr:rhodanese-like domain-containing protein [Bacteroidales bacterium]
IPGAVNIDVKREDFDELAAAWLDLGRPVAVYCRSGARSKVAAKRLAGKGFKVYELNHGIMNWNGPKEK